MSEDNLIPTVELYRGVGIHEGQSQHRIDAIVKPAIDIVSAMTDADELVRYAADTAKPPEARLLAAARVEALWEMASEARVNRPKIDMKRLRASVAGLASSRWRHPHRFTTLLDPSERAPLRDG